MIRDRVGRSVAVCDLPVNVGSVAKGKNGFPAQVDAVERGAGVLCRSLLLGYGLVNHVVAVCGVLVGAVSARVCVGGRNSRDARVGYLADLVVVDVPVDVCDDLGFVFTRVAVDEIAARIGHVTAGRFVLGIGRIDGYACRCAILIRIEDGLQIGIKVIISAVPVQGDVGEQEDLPRACIRFCRQVQCPHEEVLLLIGQRASTAGVEIVAGVEHDDAHLLGGVVLVAEPSDNRACRYVKVVMRADQIILGLRVVRLVVIPYEAEACQTIHRRLQRVDGVLCVHKT